MPQRRPGAGAEVFASDVVAVVENRADLGPQDHRLGASGARPVTDEPLGHVAGPWVFRMSGQDQGHGVPLEIVGDRYLPGQPRQLDDSLAVKHRADARFVGLGRPVQDRLQLLGGRIFDQQLEKEPVELGFGERIGSFHLQRVLGGQHEERRQKPVRRTGDGDRPLLHGLEQGGLGLGRGPVDLVGQEQIGKDRPALKLERTNPLRRFEHDVGADQVGRHQIGGELDALKLQAECVGQRTHQQGFAEPGHAFEQDVPAGDQGGQRVVDDVRKPNDDLTDFGAQRSRSRNETGRAAF